MGFPKWMRNEQTRQADGDKKGLRRFGGCTALCGCMSTLGCCTFCHPYGHEALMLTSVLGSNVVQSQRSSKKIYFDSTAVDDNGRPDLSSLRLLIKKHALVDI